MAVIRVTTFEFIDFSLGMIIAMTADDISNLFNTKPSLTQLAEYTEIGDELSVHKDKISKRVEFALKMTI